MSIVMGFIVLCGLVLINVPIAIAIGAVALLGMVHDSGFVAIYNAALTLFDSATNFPLIAIPLFILAGGLMNTTSISRRLIDFCLALVGFIRGGLAMVNVTVSLFFAEISGSAVADVAATGSVLIPAMKKRGFSAHFSAAVTSSTASLAIIIPPSIPMILYGALSDTSVIQLFIAGVIPGLIGAALMFLICYRHAIKHGIPGEIAFSIKRLGETAREAGWALTLPIIILGGIFGGIVTATEGAGLAVVAALVIGGLIYRDLDIRTLYSALTGGVIQTATVMLLVATSAILGLYLTETELPQKLAKTITDVTTNPFLILIIINLMLFVLGMFLHGAAAIILTVPILLPLIHQVGIDPVHFGIILTLNIAVGQQTPPVASVLATSCAIAKTDIWRTTRANMPLIGVLFAVLFLATYVPGNPFDTRGDILPMSKPAIGIIPGDPNGIGPELIAKLLATPAIRKAEVLLVGDPQVFELGARQAGVSLDLSDSSTAGGGKFRVHEISTIKPHQVAPGQPGEAAGNSTIRQMDACLKLCKSGEISGFLFGPFNKEAMHLAGLGHSDELHYMAAKLGFDGYVCELNAMDELFTSRVTSHIALQDVAAHITEERILDAVHLLNRTMKAAGRNNPVISVAALNPHAGDGGNFGREEIDLITPAVKKAARLGVNADGPWPADTIFLRAKEGKTDAIVTMYHDQGQIAMKLMGFDRGITVQGGLPYPVVTPAHGTAFDIAGKGAADSGATLAAFDLLISLCSRSTQTQ